MVTSVTNINDVLDRHVGLDLSCVDRLYLNAYVPKLQVAGQVVTFLTEHLGFPIPSPALLEKIGNRFRCEVKAFAAWGSRRLPWWQIASQSLPAAPVVRNTCFRGSAERAGARWESPPPAAADGGDMLPGARGARAGGRIPRAGPAGAVTFGPAAPRRRGPL